MRCEPKNPALLGVATVFVVILTLWYLCGKAEPVYGGRPIGEWIRTFAVTGSPGFGSNMSQWSNFFDSRAVPFAVKALSTRDQALRKTYRAVWPNLPSWIGNRSGPPVYPARVREAGVFVLATIENDSKAAKPALIQLWKEDDDIGVRKAAAECLRRIAGNDEEVRTAFVESSSDKDVNIRRIAVQTLRYFSWDPSVVVSVFVRSLQDEAASVRYEAAQSLLVLSNSYPVTLPELRKILPNVSSGIQSEISSLANQIEAQMSRESGGVR